MVQVFSREAALFYTAITNMCELLLLDILTDVVVSGFVFCFQILLGVWPQFLK